MRLNFFSCLFAFIVLINISCSKNSLLERLEYIKTVGNEKPEIALIMLDSIDVEIEKYDEYTKNKFELLRIRLNDKAYHLPHSDLKINKLIDYFEAEGNTQERQEVFYYAGSIYRDLKDTPRALEYFFKSLEYTKTGDCCDSAMLRNTYSNLGYLYYDVQDYQNALKMSQKELYICQKIKDDDVLSYMHLGTNYIALDSLYQAKTAFNNAFKTIIASNDISRYHELLVNLLDNYSKLRDISKARKCFSVVDPHTMNNCSNLLYIAYAHYYEAIGETDSAVTYYQYILDKETDLDYMYDASKTLFRLYHEIGNIEKANLFAQKYLELSDSIDFGKRQELAATVNNTYQYHLDLTREQTLKEEKNKSERLLILVSFLSSIGLLTGIYIYTRRKNKYLMRIVSLSSDLQKLSYREKQLREEIRKKEEQNKSFIKILHQSELQTKAEDVITSITQSSIGKKNMEKSDWKMLYQAVNELYPSFHDNLLKELGDFDERHIQFCYLVKAGLSNGQIQNIMDLSHATVWRWRQRYDWVLTSETRQEQ